MAFDEVWYAASSMMYYWVMTAAVWQPYLTSNVRTTIPLRAVPFINQNTLVSVRGKVSEILWEALRGSPCDFASQSVHCKTIQRHFPRLRRFTIRVVWFSHNGMVSVITRGVSRGTSSSWSPLPIGHSISRMSYRAPKLCATQAGGTTKPTNYDLTEIPAPYLEGLNWCNTL